LRHFLQLIRVNDFGSEKSMRRVLRLSVVALTLAASGCASFHSTTQGVLAGGLFGAAIGVAATAVSGGSLGTGAAIGGAVGALAGGYVGCMDSGRCK
jgi:osmotically inducible lipoprotein OsmB